MAGWNKRASLQYLTSYLIIYIYIYIYIYIHRPFKAEEVIKRLTNEFRRGVVWNGLFYLHLHGHLVSKSYNFFSSLSL